MLEEPARPAEWGSEVRDERPVQAVGMEEAEDLGHP